MYKKTIGCDFDGVIHSYTSGWKGIIPTDPPTEGAREAIKELRKNFKVVVFSTRCMDPEGPKEIQKWLDMYGIEVDAVVTEKPKAVLMIDDRGLRFEGNWSDVLEFTKTSMEPWNRK